MMQPPKPPKQLKRASPPRAQLPQSLPPPKPFVVAHTPPTRLPSVPPPSMPPPSALPLSAPPQAVAPKPAYPVAAPVSKVAKEEPAEFYVSVDEEILTLDRTKIQQQLDDGKLTGDTLVCEVGASQWVAISAAPELKLRLPEPSSSAHVLETELLEEHEAAADQFSVREEPVAQAEPVIMADSLRSPATKPSKNPLPFRTKATRVAWVLLGVACLLIVAQRNGGLYVAASSMGQAQSYEAFEKELSGGPGSATVRGAELLWRSKVAEGTLPFSAVGTTKPAPGAMEAD